MKKLPAILILCFLLPVVRGEELAPLPPPPGRLLSPAAGAVIEGKISEQEFVWSVVETARRYHLEVASDRNFYRVLRDLYLEDNRYSLDRLPPGSYYWRVSSVSNRGLEGRASPVGYFVYPDSE